MSARAFRSFLVAEALLLVFWVWLGTMGDPFLPGAARAAEDASAVIDWPWMQRLSPWLHLITLGTWLGGMVLLWMLRPAGRLLYAGSVVLGIVEILPVNFMILSGPLIALTQLTTLVSAVILIAPFLPPLRDRFRTPRADATAHQSA